MQKTNKTPHGSIKPLKINSCQSNVSNETLKVAYIEAENDPDRNDTLAAWEDLDARGWE